MRRRGWSHQPPQLGEGNLCIIDAQVELLLIPRASRASAPTRPATPPTACRARRRPRPRRPRARAAAARRDRTPEAPSYASIIAAHTVSRSIMLACTLTWLPGLVAGLADAPGAGVRARLDPLASTIATWRTISIGSTGTSLRQRLIGGHAAARSDPAPSGRTTPRGSTAWPPRRHRPAPT